MITDNQRNYTLIIAVFAFFLAYALFLFMSTKSVITLLQILLYSSAIFLLIIKNQLSILISKITIGLTMILGGTLLIGGALLVVIGVLMQGESGAATELFSQNMLYGIFNLGLGILLWRKLETIEFDADLPILELNKSEHQKT